MSASRDQRRDLGQAFAVFALVLALVAVFIRIDVEMAFVGHVGSSLIAVLLLYVPVAVAWKLRPADDLGTYGFHLDPVGKGLGLGLGVWLVVFPLFAAGYLVFYEVACQAGSGLSVLAPPGSCARFSGWDSPLAWIARLEGVPHSIARLLTDCFDVDARIDLAEFAAAQLVVVALPEELFFRGFLHHLLEKAIPPRRRFLGGGVGWALVISSAMFAVIHLPKAGPLGLATFFPGLMFGWMRSATGSILAPTLAHASSNLFVRILDLTFMR